MSERKINILAVCRWPLGGIRTFLKYNYGYFRKAGFEITVLASDEIETGQLKKDLAEMDIELIVAGGVWGKNALFVKIARVLMCRRFDLIHTHGFISGFHASLANRLFGRRHVLTTHGVMEERYFAGRGGKIKLWLFERVLKNVDIFHAVGEDIAGHIRRMMPGIERSGARFEIIKNGIMPDRFLAVDDSARELLGRRFNISDRTAIFGYFGRFMPEKGFENIIKAVKLIDIGDAPPRPFKVLAVGSGDYESEYRELIKKENLESKFIFSPFVPDIAPLMKGCEAVLMPSLWEAYPILSSEALVAGIPLIASDCFGLREAVAGTPAIGVRAGDAKELADAMLRVLKDPAIRESFESYKNKAAEIFHVKNSAAKLIALFRSITSDAR